MFHQPIILISDRFLNDLEVWINRLNLLVQDYSTNVDSEIILLHLLAQDQLTNVKG